MATRVVGKLEVDVKPVAECLRRTSHARMDGRTSRKHNTGAADRMNGGGIKIDGKYKNIVTC